MKAHEILMRLKAVSDFSDVQSNVKTMQQALAKLQLPDNFKKNFENIFSDLEKEAVRYQRFLDGGLKTKGDITGLEKSGERISNLFGRIHKEISKISDDDIGSIFKVDPALVKDAQNKIKAIEDQIKAVINVGGDDSIFSGFSAEIKKLKDLGSKSKFYDAFEKSLSAGDIKGASKALEDLKKNHKAFNDAAKNNAWDTYIGNLEKGLDSLNKNTSIIKLVSDLEKAEQAFRDLDNIELGNNINSVRAFGDAAGTTSKEIYTLTQNQKESATESLNLSNTLDHFKDKAAYFFGIANSIELFKRAVRDAYQSVKELDKVMTETAVVTDFTIGDMWEQLPEYSKRASELGVSIKGAYESATLYYQQGLKTDEVIAASSETLKMARIAGMDYAEATNYMTAALRGFNMEINEQSAQRVNDVYSELAAITASDTEEISKAMTKTASIADSANMEFETTAAFLAQIIETTREAPETAGTALKTVIARFQELKKDPAEIGEVEGEIVDANKIETALRTIDVALRDTKGQFRDLDDVFLEIASKWDTLDLNTQRYIATMAAGSRQQSRFIAMMSDYGRTMELVNAANNSAGASQDQFEKTLDSLESKLARLDNAWTNFTMGITNNVLVKTGVDTVYGLVEAINKMTDILPGGAAGVAKLGLSLVALKTGGKIFDNIFKNFKEQGKDKAPFERMAGTASKSLDDLKKTLAVKSKELEKVFSKDYWLFSPKDTQNFKNQLDLIDDLGQYTGDDEQDKINAAYRTSEIDKLNKSLKSLGASQEDYNNLQLLGFSNDQKALYLTNATTRAKISEILAREGLSDAERKELIQKEFNNASLKEGIIISAKDSIQKVKHALAIKYLGEKEAEAATWTAILNAGLGKSILISLGAAAAIAALAGAYIYIKNNTPEAKLEKASEATKRAKDTANEAKNAYDNLLSDQDKYNELQDKLDGLTKGTKEWEQALFEANQQVLELLQNYEGLKVITGENSELEITNLDELIQKQKEYADTAQVGAAVATVQEKAEKEKAISAKLTRPQVSGGYADMTTRPQALAEYTDAELVELQKKYEDYLAESSNRKTVTDAPVEYPKELADFTKETGLAADGLKEYNTTIQELRKAELDRANSAVGLSSALYSGLSQNARNSEFAGITTNKIAELKVDTLETDVSKKKETLSEDRTELAAQYKELTGQIADTELTIDELKDTVARYQISNEYQKSSEDLIKYLDKAGEEEKKAISAYLSNGGTFKKGEAEEFSLSEDTIKALAEILEVDESVIRDEEKEAKKNGIEGFNKVLENAQKLVGEEGSKGTGVVAEASNLISLKASLSQYEGYMENLTTLMGRAAAEGGEQAGIAAGNFFNDKLTSLLELVEDDESKQKILDIFASADFTTEQGIKEFGKDLEEVDDKLKNVDMNQLVEELIDLADAAKNVDLSNLLSQVKSLRDLADSIRDRDRGEGVSQEEFDAIIKDGAAEISDFVFTGQEYIYKGTMEELANALDNSSNKLLDGVIPAIEESIDRGDKVAKILDSGKYAENQEKIVNGELDVTKDEDRVLARDFLKDLGADEEVVNSLNDAALSSAITSALEDYNNRFANKQQLEARGTHAAQAQLYGMSAAEMATSGYSDDLVEEVQQTKINSEGLEATIAQLRKTLKVGDDEIAKYNGLLIDLASSSKMAKESQSQLAKVVTDNNDALKGSDIGEYTSALQAIHEQAEKTFGTELPEDFVEKNITKFADLAKGGEVGRIAFYELGKLAGEEYLDGLDSFSGDAEGLVTKVLEIIPKEAKMGITAEMDVSALMKAADDAGIKISELKALINTLGFSVEIETEGIWTDGKGRTAKSWGEAVGKYGANHGLTYQEVAVKGLVTGNNDGTSRGSSRSGSSSKWENPYDKQYNTLEDINEAQRERNKLEKELNLLKAKGEAGSQDYVKTYQEIYANLEKQKALQKKLREGRKQELEDLQKANAAYQKYAVYDAATQTIDINWTELNKVKATDEKTGKAIENYISELERITSSLEDIEDEILEIEQNQAELKQEALDAYVALEERTIAALEKIRQDEIESMQEGFEALTEAEEELADAISKSIDEMRQARENEKTEDEIAEKERRLAYLRQDTTGSNALEIKRLEEEIAEQRENYQDALIDQALENLQDQNELAAEQRDRQIELMESQLEHDIETGALAREATQLVEDALRDGVFTHDDALYGILSEGEGWPSKTEKMLEQILAELQEQFGKAAALDSMGQYTEEEFMNEIADQNYMQAMVDRYNSNGGVIDDYIRDLNDQRNAKINSGYYQGSQPPLYGDAAIRAEIEKKVGDQATEDTNAAAAGYKIYRSAKPMTFAQISEEVEVPIEEIAKLNPELNPSNIPAWKNVKIPSWAKYKNGGLADFTGPAWLDGSKSKPELVLNARDTQNFIMLKDILSGILTNATPSKSSGGDNYFDIDITVEEISNDYDVDRMAERIKQNIYEDSMYRNVNAVNFLR